MGLDCCSCANSSKNGAPSEETLLNLHSEPDYRKERKSKRKSSTLAANTAKIQAYAAAPTTLAQAPAPVQEEQKADPAGSAVSATSGSGAADGAEKPRSQMVQSNSGSDCARFLLEFGREKDQDMN